MRASNDSRPRILIVGCGGIGGVIGATLHKKRIDISIATTNEEVRAVWTNAGPSLGGKLVAPPLASDRVLRSAVDSKEPFDLVFVAVQPPQIESVTREISGALTSAGRVICLSNGLCEEHMAEILGPERVIGAVVGWGARMKAPGHYTRTSKGGFRVGKLIEDEDAHVDKVMALLKHVGPVRRTPNLRGARLSKLTINCAVTALGTIGGSTLGQLLVRTDARQLALALMREAVEVAALEGIRLEKVAGIDLAKLAARVASRKKIARAAQHALLLAVGARYRKLRSSMLAAMERGREPAIDHINGAIVALGRKRDFPTPYNQAATEVVWAIYRGEQEPGAAALLRVSEIAKSLGG